MKSTTEFFKDYYLNPLYYVVELKEQANHLFSIMEQFGNMNLKAIAVAQISNRVTPYNPGNTPDDPDNPPPPPFVEKINQIRNNNGNTIYGADLFDGKCNHFREPNKKIHTVTGKAIQREENLSIYDGNPNTNSTPDNGSKKYNWYELESINLDLSN